MIQILACLLGIALGYTQRVPIKKMINSASLNEEKEFHRANAIVKILVIAALYEPNIFLIGSCSLILWTSFDLSVNYFMGWKWNYLGHTAWIDKKMWSWFGKDAERNAFILKVLLIVLLNVLYTR